MDCLFKGNAGAQVLQVSGFGKERERERKESMWQCKMNVVHRPQKVCLFPPVSREKKMEMR